MLGGVFEPVEPPVEKPETPTTPPSTEDLLTIKINDEIMAVVGTNTWNAIAYGNGKYVAVGVVGGYITTSTDGINWTTPKKQITASGSIITGCTFANGRFYITGSQNYRSGHDTVEAAMIWQSTDGETWTGAMVPDDIVLCFESLIYVDNIFFIGCHRGYIMVANDNVANGSLSKPNEKDCNSIWIGCTYGSGKVVAVSMNGLVAVSTDNGGTWNTYVTEASFLRNIAYGNGKFVAIGGNVVICSADAKTWIKKELTGFTANQIVYINDLFVIAGNDGYVMTSTDGITWFGPIQIKNESGAPITNHLYEILAMS